MDRTGVEMEALTAVAVAALTIYDMLKSVDRAMAIERIVLEVKRGGKSGEFVRTRAQRRATTARTRARSSLPTSRKRTSTTR